MAGIDDYSGTPASNTTINGIDVDENCAPSGINNAIRQLMADVRNVLDDIGAKQVSSGTDTVTLTSVRTITAYRDGQAFGFIAGGTNTGAATLNIDSVGAKAIRKRGDVALDAGDIIAGMPVLVVYDASANSAAGAWMLFNPATVSAPSSAWVPASDDGAALGTTSLQWSDLFLASGAVINFNNGDVTLTHSSNTLTLAGGGFYMADNILSRPYLIDYAETINAIGSIGGGTQDIDVSLGNVVSGTVDTSTTTFTFSNPPATGRAGSFTLILTNGGSQTVNWPSSVDWAGGSAPSLTSSGVDVLTFFTLDAGTIWYGFAAGLDMQ